MTEQPVDADELGAAEIAALKRAEAANRDRGAASYEQRLETRRGEGQLTAEARSYLHHLAPHASHDVLDAGAGVGRLALQVAPRVRKMVCVDFSGAALSMLRDEAARRRVSNVETVQSDLCNLPRSLGPFDTVYSVEVFQHIPSHRERLAAAKRLYGALKPGGTCLLSVVRWRGSRRGHVEKEGYWGEGPGKLYAYYFTPRELAALLEEAGFRNVRLRGVIVLPKQVTRRLPFSTIGLESLCTRLSMLSGAGKFVLAIARR